VAAPAPAGGQELDRVVAVIRSPGQGDPHVVTLSRLREETSIALVYRGSATAATEPLDAGALGAGLEWLIDQTLLGDEAARLKVFEIDAAEAAGEVARFRARFDRPADYAAFLARFELGEKELEAVLRRMLRVRRYVDGRVSHARQVSEAEVSAWLERHPGEAGAGAADRRLARARLIEERVGAEGDALVRDLRGRAEVRVLTDLGAAPGRLWPAGAGR
jgi:hypothetical protein